MDADSAIGLVERGPMPKAEANQIVDWLQQDLDVHGRYDRGQRGRWEMVQAAGQHQVLLRIQFKNLEDYAMFRLTWS